MRERTNALASTLPAVAGLGHRVAPNRLAIYPLGKSASGDLLFMYNDALRERSRVDDFVAYFLAHRALFGATALDQAVFGLLNDHADRSAWLPTWPSGQPPETVIFFEHGFELRPCRAVVAFGRL